MRLHSDVLQSRDIYDAIRSTGLSDAGVYVDKCDQRGSRKRARAFEFRLAAEGREGRSKRRRNTGHWGAEDGFQPAYQYAATYDEHGKLFNALFRLDSEAIIGQYNGYRDFNFQTGNRYNTPEGES